MSDRKQELLNEIWDLENQLEEALEGMVGIPNFRRTDLNWLSKNLGAHPENRMNHNYKKVQILMKKIAKKDKEYRKICNSLNK